jgi:hypothetical protein
MKATKNHARLSRRELLGHAMRTSLALPAAAAVGALAACGDSGGEPGATPPEKPAGARAPQPSPTAAPKPAAPRPAAPKPAAEAGDQRLVTEIPAHATLVTSLGYVNVSPEAGQQCAGCQLYTAGDGAKGKCALFQSGLVAEKGWCKSWVKRVG